MVLQLQSAVIVVSEGVQKGVDDHAKQRNRHVGYADLVHESQNIDVVKSRAESDHVKHCKGNLGDDNAWSRQEAPSHIIVTQVVSVVQDIEPSRKAYHEDVPDMVDRPVWDAETFLEIEKLFHPFASFA